MSAYILGIDGGQTATKLLVTTIDGQIVWRGQGGSAFSGRAGDFRGGAERRLAQVLRQALAARWQGVTFEAAALGMSGAEPGSPMIPAYRRALAGAVAARRYTVAHDALTNLLGASAGGPGIVVIAGGGAVAYGRTVDGREAAAGGWGYIVGDEGSGYSVGRAAINAVFCALDGRGPETRLAGRLLDHFGVPEAVALKYAIFEGRIAFQDIAALPPLVAQVAAEGDIPARRILEEAARHLAAAAAAVARALTLTAQPVRVYPTGGLFREERFLAPAFRQAVAEALPAAEISPPAFEPVVGAALLALQASGRGADPATVQNLAASWRNLEATSV